MQKLKEQILELVSKEKKILAVIYEKWIDDHAYLWDDFGDLDKLRQILLEIITLFYNKHKTQDFSQIEQMDFHRAIDELLSNPRALLQKSSKAQVSGMETVGLDDWFSRFKKDIELINEIVVKHERFQSSSLNINKIMGKVQDINKYGTAYTILTRVSPEEMIEHAMVVLKRGLPQKRDRVQLPFNVVWFNIVGRAIDVKDEELQISRDKWAHQLILFAFIFSLAAYREAPPILLTDEIKKRNSGEFAPTYLTNPDYYDALMSNGPIINHYTGEIIKKEQIMDGFDKPKVFTEDGFVLKDVISPSRFLGIVTGAWHKTFIMNGSYLQKIVSAMTTNALTQQDESYLLPIYDTKGNLWWPKQLTYEEVKKLH